MKRVLILLVMVVMVSLCSISAEAALELRGTDINGNRLIYDSDLNITWYDFTQSAAGWQTQMNWASALSVSGGDLVGVYDDWRLPTTVDGPWVWGYDGTTTVGYNITSSEMGHLYYTELGNKGYYDTSGNNPQAGWGLTKTGDFQNLQPNYYWSGTEYAALTDGAWYFLAGGGYQGGYDLSYGGDYYAIAVMDGDVSVVPEPVSMILFGVGAIVMGGRRMVLRRRG